MHPTVHKFTCMEFVLQFFNSNILSLRVNKVFRFNKRLNMDILNNNMSEVLADLCNIFSFYFFIEIFY